MTKKTKQEITSEDIDKVHEEFMDAMKKLFDRTKKNYPGAENAELEIY